MPKLPKQVLETKARPFCSQPKILRLLVISADDVHSDIIDRLSDPVHVASGVGIYSINRIKNILEDQKGDTKETCRYLLEELYKSIKKDKAHGIIIFYRKETE